MSKFLRAVLGSIAGYMAGALAGAALISLMSSNTHDKSLEVAMTSAFVTGPIGALIGCIWGLFVSRR